MRDEKKEKENHKRGIQKIEAEILNNSMRKKEQQRL